MPADAGISPGERYRCSHIRFWHDRYVVFLHHFHEPLGHAVTLGAAHCCCAGLQIQFSRELTRFMRPARGAVIRQLLTEALFHRSQHHILHGYTAVASAVRCPVYGFSDAAAQCKRGSQFLTIVTPEREAV